jgi:hypothetical protein
MEDQILEQWAPDWDWWEHAPDPEDLGAGGDPSEDPFGQGMETAE